VAEKLRLAIEQCPFHYGDLPVRVTVSCGVTEFGPGDAPASAFGRADRALYEAKHGGRNRCRVQPGAVDAMDRED
jgi:diguanylate cyclase